LRKTGYLRVAFFVITGARGFTAASNH